MSMRRDGENGKCRIHLKQIVPLRPHVGARQSHDHDARLVLADGMQQFLALVHSLYDFTVRLCLEQPPDDIARHPIESDQQRSCARHDTVLRFRATERAPRSGGCECIVRADLDSATAWIMWPAGI